MNGDYMNPHVLGYLSYKTKSDGKKMTRIKLIGKIAKDLDELAATYPELQVLRSMNLIVADKVLQTIATCLKEAEESGEELHFEDDYT